MARNASAPGRRRQFVPAHMMAGAGRAITTGPAEDTAGDGGGDRPDVLTAVAAGAAAGG